ncbi:hybrid sensor histidine kinase/response regulator [Marinomonas posidonica]|uniref:histidine kinase n=1 Tax=Marinomonas posidonica (strain CECT 7376 / NCIMB 14433 / IVIA-Po-181) TaxID=491952 RepID=F6D0A1_MARPP|nr:ATP-binding protein [Marinomonas posidonica]AEF53623.1 integral membrane sensor hybrid histidine kinase [Marinomonas posidonica IVIA-Po-181]
MNSAPQDISLVRRHYNQWVANQTLEDYALRFTAKSARRWSISKVAITALGAISFLVLEAIGGAITLSHGFTNAIAAILVVSVIIFLTGAPIAYYSSKHGIDIDLLTRGAGFGYIGSTVASLIYASFTFIFFALEASVLALALELTLGLKVSIGYIVSSVIIIPIVTHGITFISRFQVWSQPIWLILQCLPLACIALQYEEAFELWVNFEPTITPNTSASYAGFSILAFGAAASVLFSLIAQIGEQVDFLRFLPKQNRSNKKAWWLAVICAGPGWIIIGAIKMLIGSFLAVLCLQYGFSAEDAEDPNQMYKLAFSYVTSSEQLSLLLLGVFVIISQLKINVTNAYAGSIAWSNFFSRLTYNHPGRVVWLVFNVIIAILLMELGIYRVLEGILGGYAIVALSWIGSIVADLTINKPLGLRPNKIEFKRAHLYDINPVGIGSMLGASIIGFIFHAGLLGEEPQALSSFIALFTTFILSPLIAWLTKGKYYIARPEVIFHSKEELQCSVCHYHFEKEDMTHCPAYSGKICSLCCSLDVRCGDMCKSRSRLSEQFVDAFSQILPASWLKLVNTRMGHFLWLFLLNSLVIACVLLLVYGQIILDKEHYNNAIIDTSIASALINVFLILLIVFGVVAWMFSLARDSRHIAHEETERQTRRLKAEIEAHSKTDLALQKAKELAEAANLAKSRYLTGISHELRSPLNAIMGYAQLLENAQDIPQTRRGALTTIKHSSEHLADIIEGLLDISSIEAGTLHIERNDVQLKELIHQLVNMFSMQAKNKNIEFHYQQLTKLPTTVHADQKRLRQVLINLLSNAIKYTHQGSVTFSVSYRNQVMYFSVIDTGVGIEKASIDKIFLPFKRLIRANKPYIAGTGLGLTITRLLVDIMGGDLQVNSTPNKGSEFSISFMLSSVEEDTEPKAQSETHPSGYDGEKQYVFVVDDDPSQRSLLSELLAPIGFEVFIANNGIECLDMLMHCPFTPNLFLLDVTMPGMNGWQLAAKLRDQYPQSSIIMISANANTDVPLDRNPSNGYLLKPLRHTELFNKIQQVTNIQWHFIDPHKPQETSLEQRETPLNRVLKNDLTELIQLANIGNLNAIRQKIHTMKMFPNAEQILAQANDFQFDKVVETLEEML